MERGLSGEELGDPLVMSAMGRGRGRGDKRVSDLTRALYAGLADSVN